MALSTHLRWVVFGLFAMKMAVTTLSRAVYPFAEYLADTLDVSESTFFLAISIGELVGAFSPVLGPCSERMGPRRLLLLTCFLLVLASVATGVSLYSFPAFLAAWIVFSVIKTLYNAAHSAYIGVYVPKPSRARVTGIGEFAWGASSFAGLAFVGVVVDELSDAWVFYFMAMLMAATTCLMLVLLKRNPLRRGQSVRTLELSVPSDLPETIGRGVELNVSKSNKASGSPAPPAGPGLLQADVHSSGAGMGSEETKRDPSSEHLDSLADVSVAIGKPQAQEIEGGSGTQSAAGPDALVGTKLGAGAETDHHPAAAEGAGTAVKIDAGIEKSRGEDGTVPLDQDKGGPPTSADPQSQAESADVAVDTRPIMLQVISDIPALLLILCITCGLTSNVIVFGSYAKWLEEEHDLSASALGLASTSIGVAEILGEVGVILVSGRMGLDKALGISLAGAALSSFAFLLVLESSLPWNLTVLFLESFFVELVIVFVLAMGTHVLEHLQTAFFTVIHSAVQVARFLAALLVTPIFDAGGMGLVAVIAAGLQIVGLGIAILLFKFVKNREREEANASAQVPSDTRVDVDSGAHELVSDQPAGMLPADSESVAAPLSGGPGTAQAV